jgi:ketosteroid isomerase-like protein
MSHENVEIVKRMIDAFNERDLKAMLALSDPDLEMDWSASKGLEPGVYRGAEVERYWLGYFDAFEEVITKPERFIDAGESVVVPNVAHLLGRDGIEVSARSTVVYTLRNEKVTHVCLYEETEEALEAVGLPG